MKPYVGPLRAFLRLRICRIHESIMSQICPKPFPGLNLHWHRKSWKLLIIMTASSPQLRPRARAYRVFISSTFLDLSAERKAVCDALSDLNAPLAGLGVCLIPMDLQGGADAQGLRTTFFLRF